MILTFSNWKITKPSGTLGYQYDNLTRELVVQGDLPEGWTWDMLVSASGNSDTWPLALGDGQASITLTDDNLSVRGEYYLQLRGTNGDQVRHTNVITAYNSRSLSGAGQWPTLPTEWIQAEKDIKELNAHPPVPGSDGYWLLWDLSSHSYQESDLPVPVGPAGPPNVLEIGTVETLPADQPATASITGESPAQKLNLGIPQGKQGATGNPGAPGKDGQNGVTPTLSAGNVETLDPDQPATASVTGEGPEYQINLGIPQGKTGETGATGPQGPQGIQGPIGATGPQGNPGATPTITVGTVTTLGPGQDATAEITGETPNLVLSLGIPQGQPGKDGVQLEDDAVTATAAWSSLKIVDTLCPSFSVSGNPVICHPVEDYPLNAVVSLEPKQAGSGDPSPENVRPISGYDGVTVTQSKDGSQVKQITLTLPETIYGGTVDAVTGVGSEEWAIVTLSSEFLTTNRWVYGANSNQTSPAIYGEIPMANSLVGDMYCTHFKRGNTIPLENLEYWSDSQYFGIRRIAIRNDEWTSLDDAKTWLDAQASAGTPVQVAYKLATPEPFQATGNQPLPAVAGLNTVYTDGDSLSVSGRQDLLYTLQNMQAQTQNLNRFIAEGGTP